MRLDPRPALCLSVCLSLSLCLLAGALAKLTLSSDFLSARRHLFACRLLAGVVLRFIKLEIFDWRMRRSSLPAQSPVGLSDFSTDAVKGRIIFYLMPQ